jgi:parvulin-like peptidyl-prolyl isomerase
MRARALAIALLIPAVFLTSSCTKREDRALAEFGDQKITVGDFEKAYAVVKPEFLPTAAGIEGRREFLTTMLNKEVMAYKADELGYDKDPGVVQGMEAWKKMGLQAGYLKRKVADQVTVSEEEARWHHKNTGATASIKQILVDTPDEAEEVVALLDAGEDFESVCKKYSKAPDASGGGEVLTIGYGRYAPELQEAIFRLEVGEHTEPILTPYGFFIMKLLRRNDSKAKDPFEQVKERMEQEYRVIKEMLETNEHTEKLRDEYGVEWYWDNMRICFQALPPDRDFEQAPSRSDEVYPLLYFDEEDLNKPVAAFGEQMILVKDFSDYYDEASFYARPRRSYRVGGIHTFIMERIMAQIVTREMKRSGIEEDPEVKAAMEGKREELMINRLWEDMINKQTVVTDAMIREYYDEHAGDFQVPEKRRFGVILTNDYDNAQRAYQELQAGTLFRTVAMAYSVDETTKRTLGETDLLTEGEQPEIDEVGFALEGVGSFSEPFQTSRGWMILKVTELEPASTYTIEQARGTIRSALKEQLNDDRLNELLSKWKEELNVVIYDENLEKIQVEERSPDAKTTARAGA